jgi:hypothetical protein
VRRCIARALLFIPLAAAAQAGPAPFDLAGPAFEVTVARGGTTLPLSQVPNLAVKDQLWIRADLPASQSAHYLMVIAFLSGSTNPPPENWFYACKTWTGQCAHDGLTVTVPVGAQQVLLFLAPQTGGDFRTLREAVRGRPGAFVRTSQDLNQAALDRSRLEHFLAAMRNLNDGDPARIKAAAPLLARSLAIKVNDKCLDRIPELQAPCLMQGEESLILNDGHSTSIVETLTSGPGSDLAMEASYTPQLGYGYYSPYLASVLDIARILDSFHVAQYQYIPALGSQHGNQLALTLNAAPSFENPKSVLVAALPAVEESQLPPLHAVDPKEIYCARQTRLVLPVEGAPLVFATDYAHGMRLRLMGKDGKTVELPATADALEGGYVIDTSTLQSAVLSDSVEASLRGRWGFDEYSGPTFRLENAHAVSWRLAAGDATAAIIGRQDVVHLRAESVSCIDGIMLKDPAGKEVRAEWKAIKPNEVEVKLPLQDAQPGALTLMVAQAGLAQAQSLPIQAYREAGRFDDFRVHVGDTHGVLRGSRLDEVASLALGALVFLPGELSPQGGNEELSLFTQDAQAMAALKPTHAIQAKLTLIDGRVLSLPASVEPPRPRVVLLNKSVQSSLSNDHSNIRLLDSELPTDAMLIFSVRSESPATFSRDASVEISASDLSVATSVNVLNGGMTFENSRVAVITFSPAKAFGASAFGPLQYRVNDHGVTGDWQPLVTLVRLPALADLKCPSAPELACKLSGSSLYLIDSVASDPQFENSVDVPDGFLGSALPAPHPLEGTLYLKLRDDPNAINASTLMIEQLPDTADDLAKSAVRAPAIIRNNRAGTAPSDALP